MISEKQMASAVGAKTARACDICVKKRARWYCGADDAFLCQSCDDSVHSANPLARRHERVRFKNASSASAKGAGGCLPTWHRGPTRKPRTPRHPKKPAQSSNSSHHLLVPELDTSTSMEEEEEEQLLYRVPVYEQDPYSAGAGDLGVSQGRWFLQPADFDMADFAADVEALLGKGLDEEHACGIEDLGLLINPHEGDDSSAIKFEKEEEEVEEMEVIREPFELSFDYDSPADLKVAAAEPVEGIDYEEKKEWKMLLRLDYDAVSNSWGSQGSPWTNGKRPDFSPRDDFWPLLGDCGTEIQGSAEIKLMVGGQIGGSRGGDGGREARVSRYREKRRTRLFSKKIRYEVRKLNAEKRPRMKGRFVKRSSFPLLTK